MAHRELWIFGIKESNIFQETCSWVLATQQYVLIDFMIIFHNFTLSVYLNIYLNCAYRQVFNISRTLVGNKIVDHADVVRAIPVGAAPTTSSFST